MENPPSKFFRLAPGREVRLRYAYFITCKEVVKDPATGEVVELRCTYDPATRGGDAPDGRKVKATIHWVAAEQSLPAKVRVYEHLFAKADPYDLPPDGDVMDNLNPGSLRVLTDCRVEPCLAESRVGACYQFERKGYFAVDEDSKPGALVFNRTTTLARYVGEGREQAMRSIVVNVMAKGVGVVMLVTIMALPVRAEIGDVLLEQKISDDTGDFEA